MGGEGANVFPGENFGDEVDDIMNMMNGDFSSLEEEPDALTQEPVIEPSVRPGVEPVENVMEETVEEPVDQDQSSNATQDPEDVPEDVEQGRDNNGLGTDDSDQFENVDMFSSTTDYYSKIAKMALAKDAKRIAKITAEKAARTLDESETLGNALDLKGVSDIVFGTDIASLASALRNKREFTCKVKKVPFVDESDSNFELIKFF